MRVSLSLLALLPTTAFARDDWAARSDRMFDRPSASEPAPSLEPEEAIAPVDAEGCALRDEYLTEAEHKPGLGGPIALTLGGFATAGLAGAGAVLLNENNQPVALPIALAAGGAAAVLAGIAWWINRSLQRAEVDRKLVAIKARIASHGFRLSKRDEEPPADTISVSPGPVSAWLSYDNVKLGLGVLFLTLLAGAGIAYLVHQ
jgi:hypothetical protein